MVPKATFATIKTKSAERKLSFEMAFARTTKNIHCILTLPIKKACTKNWMLNSESSNDVRAIPAVLWITIISCNDMILSSTGEYYCTFGRYYHLLGNIIVHQYCIIVSDTILSFSEQYYHSWNNNIVQPYHNIIHCTIIKFLRWYYCAWKDITARMMIILSHDMIL